MTRSRPRKIITRVIVFLLLGAIVNVAVAWGFAVWSGPLGQISVGNHDLVSLFAASELPPTYEVTFSPRSGVGYFQCLLYGKNQSNEFDTTARTAWLAGWPSLSLIGWSDFDSNARSCVVIRKPINNLMGYRGIPYHPRWPGFAINTIFYAAILWLLFFAPGSVRRMIRRRRGLCPACAYPVGTSPVCTECGKPVTPRTASPILE